MPWKERCFKFIQPTRNDSFIIFECCQRWNNYSSRHKTTSLVLAAAREDSLLPASSLHNIMPTLAKWAHNHLHAPHPYFPVSVTSSTSSLNSMQAGVKVWTWSKEMQDSASLANLTHMNCSDSGSFCTEWNTVWGAAILNDTAIYIVIICLHP